MIRKVLSVACIVIVTLTTHARADAPPAKPALPALPETVKAITPLLDPQVLAVVRVDASKIDPKAIENWVASSVPKENGKPDKDAEVFLADVAKNRAQGEMFLNTFREAGGRDVYVVVSMVGMLAGPPPVVIPLPPGADGEKIAKLFPPQMPMERVGNVLISAPDATRDRLKQMIKAGPGLQPDPNLIEAISVANPNAAVNVAIAPSLTARAVFTQFLPTFPPNLGGGPTAPAIQGLRWAAISLELPPKASLRASIQAENPEAAAAIEKVINSALAEGKRSLGKRSDKPKNEKDAAAMKQISDMISKLAAKVEGNGLTIGIDAKQVEDVAGLFTKSLMHSRQQAMQIKSISNVRQIVLSCQIYQNEHKREWPDDLATAIKTGGLPAEATTNPNKPGTGYTYVKPPKDTKDTPERIVVYETEPTEGFRAVGFFDGHAERMSDATFQEMLKKQSTDRPAK